MPPFDQAESPLTGKVVIVTGAGSGLGRSYAIHAARSGAAVCVNDIDPARAAAVTEEMKADGLRASALPGDISDWDAAGEIVAGAVQEFGQLDGLVSNAGIFYTCKPWEDDGPEAAHLIRVNLLGVLFGGLRAIKVMVEQGSGVIVNVTSGAQMGLPSMGAYGASKGGIATLTYTWAMDLKEKGVRVNAVSPLAVTNMGRAGGRPVGSSSRPPLPSPDHVAPVVTYLLSELSSDLHGQVVRLEGPELSIMKHPAVPEAKVLQDSWTVAEIAAAIAGPLHGEIRHVGRD